MRKGLALIFLLTMTLSASAAPNILLWRLDCGQFVAKKLTDSCYLVKHDRAYLLWDAGLGAELIGHPNGQGTRAWIALDATLAAQLKQLGLTPKNIAILALSHTHFDHIGQASAFPGARLLVGRYDWNALIAKPASDDGRARLEPWIAGNSAKWLVTGDYDIFGDGSVVMIATPGHTPGHHSLLVRLQHFGPVLLTGDLYYSAQQYAENSVPPHNASSASTISSFSRFRKLATGLAATVIIQHEPADIPKLPAFPQAAD
jgi:glyoxylase-like metal-dependent hydrolase (beta-lactamase superfamily II)